MMNFDPQTWIHQKGLTMSADKRTVATDALETLGTLIDETAARDAVHIAVEPAVAGAVLYPGNHVKLVNGKAERTMVNGVGIVDPYLNSVVQRGQRFWLLLYPRQITSLRHVWTHPSFPEPAAAPLPLVVPAPAPNFSTTMAVTKLVTASPHVVPVPTADTSECAKLSRELAAMRSEIESLRSELAEGKTCNAEQKQEDGDLDCCC